MNNTTNSVFTYSLKEKLIVAALVIALLVVIYFIAPRNNNFKGTDVSKRINDKIWTFTMKYGKENLGYSIKSQIKLLVNTMKTQGYRCEITQKNVRHLGNELYSVSLVVVTHNTDEKCAYSWRTDMRSRKVTPISYYAKQLYYP